MIKRLTKKWTCVEVGIDKWYVWQFNHKNSMPQLSQIVVSANTLWNPQAMSQLIKGQLYAQKLFFLLNTSRTIIKLASSPFNFQTELFQNEKSGEYIISHDTIEDTTWSCAVPSEISESLVEMCRISGIRQGFIHAIDILEYRMSYYLNKFCQAPFWLFLPQEHGIRLLALQGDSDWGCYFFSNDPDFRTLELTRLWLCQPASPRQAVILSDEPDYLWIHRFLEERSVELPDMDFIKQAMIEHWIKA